MFLPVYLGLVSSQSDPVLLHSPLLQEWCTLLGRYFQIRDDYMDVYADPSVLKKEGTEQVKASSKENSTEQVKASSKENNTEEVRTSLNEMESNTEQVKALLMQCNEGRECSKLESEYITNFLRALFLCNSVALSLLPHR